MSVSAQFIGSPTDYLFYYQFYYRQFYYRDPGNPAANPGPFSMSSPD